MTEFYAATTLITRVFQRRLLVLSVSRKDNPEDKGLPGGKIEIGESPWEAAVRETFEETGVTATDGHRIFEAVDDIGYLVVVYRVFRWKGQSHSREAGVVEWLLPQEMITDECSFREFNLSLFRRVGWL